MSTKKLTKFFSLLMIIALLTSLGAGAALAQSATGVPGDSPDTAVMPTSGAVNIAPGQWHWYLFRSQIPVRAEKSKDGFRESTTATIDATVRTQSGQVDFEVWSTNDLNNWRNNVEFEPTGAGTVNESITGDPIFWRGSFSTNNNYYLIVMNHGTKPAAYTLDMLGDMSFPSHLALSTAPQAEPAMTTGEMALTVETPTQAVAAPEMATGPGNAVMPANGTVRIEPGKWQWYIFTSQKPVGVEDDKADVVRRATDATIDALLRVRSGKVDFEVWSANDLNNWRNNVEFDPTGAGTVNESIAGDPLFWQGSFSTNNNYYLVVKNRGTEPAFYTLSVTGDVSFPSTTSLPVN